MGNARSEQTEAILSEFWYRIYPELRHFKSREELREAKKAFRKKALNKRRVLCAFLVIVPVGIGLSFLAVRWLIWGSAPLRVAAKRNRSLGVSNLLAAVIHTACWAFLGVLGSLFFWHRPSIRFVRQYLQDRGVAICLKCGYDLRGLAEPRCPECGQEFDAKLLEMPPGQSVFSHSCCRPGVDSCLKAL